MTEIYTGRFKKYPKVLTRGKSALLIIDIQDRIFKIVNDYESLINNVVKLIKGIKILGLPVYYAEQYPKGLGSTIPLIRNELKGNPIYKLTFSCFEAENLFIQLKND